MPRYTIKINLLLLLVLILGLKPLESAAQYEFARNTGIQVLKGGSPLPLAWAGGINTGQFSNIDLDLDGRMDIIVFDKSTNTLLPFVHLGEIDSLHYRFAPEYKNAFPPLDSWILLRDYNCDGDMDLFSSTLGGMKVYKNSSSTSGSLSFELATDLLTYKDGGLEPQIYVNSSDIPAFADVDNDGDLDILSISLMDFTRIELYENKSMDLYGTCDSLSYERANYCWGFFSEGSFDNSIILYDTCAFNVPNPKNARLRSRDRDVLRHSGASLLALDENGNGLTDILIGDNTFNNFTLVSNGGSLSQASMTGFDANFPSYDQAIDINSFPAGFFTDINNDGEKDLMIGTNNRSGSDNYESCWYYKNAGSTANPVFVMQRKNALQDQMIEKGESAIPILVDENSDGLMDLLVSSFGVSNGDGNYYSKISLFRNTGSAGAPEFTWAMDDWENLSLLGLGPNLVPAFADLDGDGDLDAILGTESGRFHYFENTAGTGNPIALSLVQSEILDLFGATMDVGNNAHPFLYDLDGDGDLDLISGEKNGDFNYYENVGNSSSFSFKFQSNSWGDADTGPNGYSTPFLVFDKGETQLFAGSNGGYFHQYNGIDGNLMGSFNRVTDKVSWIKEGTRSAVALHDMNSDGKLDLFIGNFRGGISYFEGITFTGIQEKAEKGNFSIYPNPSEEVLNIEFREALTGEVQLRIIDVSGRILIEETMESTGSQINMELNDLAPGSYLLEIRTGGNIFHEKLIRKN